MCQLTQRDGQRGKGDGGARKIAFLLTLRKNINYSKRSKERSLFVIRTSVQAIDRPWRTMSPLFSLTEANCRISDGGGSDGGKCRLPRHSRCRMSSPSSLTLLKIDRRRTGFEQSVDGDASVRDTLVALRYTSCWH